MNKELTEVKNMTKLLEESILPLMAEMIKAMGEHSYRYESQVEEIKNKLEHADTAPLGGNDTQQILIGLGNVSELTKQLYEKSVTQEEAFNILTKAITSFGGKLTDLIDTNNKLIDHQQYQVDRIDDVMLEFEENTARLDALTLAIGSGGALQVKEEIIEGPSEEQLELAPIKKDSGSIQEVLEDEIKRLKNSTKG